MRKVPQATAAPPPTRQATEPLFERDPNKKNMNSRQTASRSCMGRRGWVLLIPGGCPESLDGVTADKWLQNPGRSHGLAVSPTPSPIFHIFCFPIANCYPCHWFPQAVKYAISLNNIHSTVAPSHILITNLH